MTDAERVTNFLGRAGWSDARRDEVAGDASARRFARLTRPDGTTAILMDAGDDAPGSSARFARLSRWINDRGFSAPAVLAKDIAAALLLVEDFGDGLFARLLEREPAREGALYAAAVEFLAEFQRAPMPKGLTPLDGPALAGLTALLTDTYLPAFDAPVTDAARAIPGQVAALYDQLAGADPLTISLRDFHAENVFWLPDRTGPARLGLIDFQDAVAAHPLYDLVSLLQDARRDLAPGTEAACLALFAKLTGQEIDRLRPIYALIGTQRALRILAVFARLIVAGGKPRYAAFIPRVWGHLQANLDHPALAPLAATIRATVPAPTPDRIERMVTCRTR